MPFSNTYDTNGNLNVNVQVGGGGGGSNVTIVGQTLTLAVEDVADGIIGSPVVADAIQIGYKDGSGNLQIPSAANPLPITGTVLIGNSGAGSLVNVQGLGAAGAPSGGVLSIQGVASGTAIPISGSVSITGNPADNIAQWGGTAVNAAATSSTNGTEADPIVRSISRKFGSIQTTTPLAANGTFTGAWIDTNQTGDTFVSMSWVSNVTSANNVEIQQTDDSTNASIPVQIVAISTAATFGNLFGNITRRYWRVVYPNGATLQTTFELCATGNSISPNLQLYTATGIPYLNSTTISTDAMVSLGLPWNNSGNTGGNGVLPVGQYAATGVTSGTPGGQTFAALRTPTIFKTASVSATASGNTAVWTPTSGKKFRLMRFQITAQGLSATAATILTISFQDSAAAITIGTYDVLLPAVANLVAGITTVSAWVDLGNGFLSAAANNVLNANISATVTGATGTFRVNACGTEE
jgi:hypothetical protein